MSRPIVSVVITTYNRKSTLLETLESIRQQTFRDFEIIVVDDGSTPRTFTNDEVDSLGIRYYWVKNGGQAAARNIGISNAIGRYISFVDDDDIWIPEKLHLQLKKIQDGFSWVYGDCIYFSHETCVDLCRHSDFHHPYEGSVFEKLLKKCFISSPTVLIESQLLDSTGLFFENREAKYGEDWFMWLQLAAKAKVGFIDRPIARYRIHEQSMLSSANMELLRKSHELGLRWVFAQLPADYQKLWVKSQKWDLQNLARISYSRRCLVHAKAFASQAFHVGAPTFSDVFLLAATRVPFRLYSIIKKLRKNVAR